MFNNALMLLVLFASVVLSIYECDVVIATVNVVVVVDDVVIVVYLLLCM